jgi:hypothetical protein
VIQSDRLELAVEFLARGKRILRQVYLHL